MTCLYCGKYQCEHTPEQRGDNLFDPPAERVNKKKEDESAKR